MHVSFTSMDPIGRTALKRKWRVEELLALFHKWSLYQGDVLLSSQAMLMINQSLLLIKVQILRVVWSY